MNAGRMIVILFALSLAWALIWAGAVTILHVPSHELIWALMLPIFAISLIGRPGEVRSVFKVRKQRHKQRGQ